MLLACAGEQLRHLFRGEGLGAIRIGSIDDFQGQEEKIIIISTVIARKRSSSRLAVGPPRPAATAAAAGPAALGPGGAERMEMPVGVFSNPKRFNVAITRAKALLVIVGTHCLVPAPAQSAGRARVLCVCASVIHLQLQ